MLTAARQSIKAAMQNQVGPMIDGARKPSAAIAPRAPTLLL